MKKFVCIVMCVLMMFSMCSCQNGRLQDENVTVSQPTAGEITNGGINEPEITQPQETNPTDPPEDITEPVATTAPTDPPEATDPPKPTDPPEVTEPPAVTHPLASLVLEYSCGTYTVIDPENTKGLSTKYNGFSYGVAKDGVPHTQSVINQQTFDGFENVQALALDTKTEEKVLYLTFDNGYEYENLTADILDTLKEKNVKAAFFVTLSYAKQNPQLVQRMIDEGHIVGNHSTTHPSFPKLTRVQMAEEIATLDNYLRENFSYTSPYFRFPSGEYSHCAMELATSLGFRSVFWSVAYADWDTTAQKGADYAFSTVTSRLHSGAVILLHAVSQDNADMLGRLIDEARDQGYAFRTLDEYFR